MVIRKDKDIEVFIDDIGKIWGLSLTENKLLETVFNLILAGKTKETADVLNFYTSEEWENLLHRVPEIDIKDFAEAYLDMIEEDDIEDANIKEFSNDELLAECDRRKIGKKSYDLSTTLQLEQLVSNFLSADFSKREEMLKIK